MTHRTYATIVQNLCAMRRFFVRHQNSMFGGGALPPASRGQSVRRGIGRGQHCSLRLSWRVELHHPTLSQDTVVLYMLFIDGSLPGAVVYSQRRWGHRRLRTSVRESGRGWIAAPRGAALRPAPSLTLRAMRNSRFNGVPHAARNSGPGNGTSAISVMHPRVLSRKRPPRGRQATRPSRPAHRRAGRRATPRAAARCRRSQDAGRRASPGRHAIRRQGQTHDRRAGRAA